MQAVTLSLSPVRIFVVTPYSDNDLIAMLEEKKVGGSVTYRVNDKYFSLIKKI